MTGVPTCALPISHGAQLGALWRSRGVGEGLKRETTYVYLQLVYVAVRQKPTQHCKAIIHQLKIKANLKKEWNWYINKCFTLFIVGGEVKAQTLMSFCDRATLPHRLWAPPARSVSSVIHLLCTLRISFLFFPSLVFPFLEDVHLFKTHLLLLIGT